MVSTNPPLISAAPAPGRGEGRAGRYPLRVGTHFTRRGGAVTTERAEGPQRMLVTVPAPWQLRRGPVVQLVRTRRS